MEEKRMICCACSCRMERKRVDFTYMGHSFFAEALRCPKCGQVYLPEELVRGRVSDVERQLEDK